jgi:hypothetical protein
MANIVPDSFKTDLLGGVFDFDSGGSTFKLHFIHHKLVLVRLLLHIQLLTKFLRLVQTILQVEIL